MDPLLHASDLSAASRNDLVDAHIVHEFDLGRVKRNHQGCYGELIRQRYLNILPLLRGKRVLDCGCGFGTFSQIAAEAGFDVYPVDIDDRSIEVARVINGLNVFKESVYHTSLADGSRDIAVCFDSIQHFEINFLLPELSRLGIRQVLIYDSNIQNPFLQTYRRAVKHQESQELAPQDIAYQFERGGFRLAYQGYENFISLPVSGGYQLPPWPIVHRFPSAIRIVDGVFERLFATAKLSRWFAFRFLLILER